MSSVTVAEWNEMLAAAVSGPITEETLRGNARVLELFAGAIVFRLRDRAGSFLHDAD